MRKLFMQAHQKVRWAADQAVSCFNQWQCSASRHMQIAQTGQAPSPRALAKNTRFHVPLSGRTKHSPYIVGRQYSHTHTDLHFVDSGASAHQRITTSCQVKAATVLRNSRSCQRKNIRASDFSNCLQKSSICSRQTTLPRNTPFPNTNKLKC